MKFKILENKFTYLGLQNFTALNHPQLQSRRYSDWMTYLTNQIDLERDPYTVPVNLGPDNSFDTAYIYKAE